MIPIQKVKDLILKHKSLEEELSSGTVKKDSFATKSKEYSELNEVINIAREFEEFEKNKKELDNLIEDQNVDDEIKNFAKDELAQLISKNIENEKKLKLFLLPKDEADTKNAII